MNQDNIDKIKATQKATIHMRIVSVILIFVHIFFGSLLYLSKCNLPFCMKGMLIQAISIFPDVTKIDRSKVFKVYHSGSNYIDPVDPKGERCLIPWDYTKQIEEASLIMYNALDNYGAIAEKRDRRLRPDQVTCVESMESASNYPAINSNKDAFNYTMTYSLTSDVPIPYSEFFETSEMPLNISEKKDHLVCAFISNCGAGNGRTKYMIELMKHIKIDSYGSCLNNAEVPSSFRRRNRYRTKEAMLSQYKFTIAFENSNDEDYITEKLYQPLRYGSVPIFRGNSNMEDFIPPHSAIDANKFKSEKELADYLHYLDKNDTAYNEYLQWKYDKNIGNMAKIRFFRDRYEYGVCALVERIHGLWINPYLIDWNRQTKAKKMCNKCLDGFDISKRRIPVLREDGWTYNYPLGKYWSVALNMTIDNETEVEKNEKVELKKNFLLLKEYQSELNSIKKYAIVETIFSVFAPLV